MADRSKKIFRCAIYTRKSSEEGLEEDFNSLHAQREACLAFIASQKHEGWTPLPAMYDDGGISGGTMERPALQKLLADIEAGQIDVVVVYKIDRLTRSLLDFAKIVEIFDKQNVSFVSVTQQFSTTSSMGRLTLNVLLSFAQFEREVTGERIRDKIAASKKKGMWMGGFVPLGYQANERTLSIDEREASTVRIIFALYLKLKNVRLVEDELRKRGLNTKQYLSKTGKTTGGKPFSRGHIYRILASAIYVGEIEHRGVRHAGLHSAIVDRDTFDAAQALLAANGHAHRARANANDSSLLAGLLHDAAGNPLLATHSGKSGKRYRYYVAKMNEADGTKGALRIAASEVEPFVLHQIIALLTDEQRLVAAIGPVDGQAAPVARIFTEARKLAAHVESGTANEQRVVLAAVVRRIVLDQQSVRIEVRRAELRRRLVDADDETDDHGLIQIATSVTFARRGVETRLMIDRAEDRAAHRPPDAALFKAVARGHVWFEELILGRARSIVEIAKREGVSDRFVSILLNLAFLAPSVVEAIIEGQQPSELTAKDLMFAKDIPILWTIPAGQNLDAGQ